VKIIRVAYSLSIDKVHCQKQHGVGRVLRRDEIPQRSWRKQLRRLFATLVRCTRRSLAGHTA